ncbi:MAG: phosphatidylglycerophosphatase A [Limnobacter sp.]|nr:phosphatidylglycerophosphatase A [Limnobacter sp.]
MQRIRPDWRFAMAHPFHFVALGFGSGLAWVLPGTFGTLMGWLLFVGLNPFLNDWAWGLLIGLCFAAGIPVCGCAGKALGVVDHGSIVWDEIVAIWLVLFVSADQLGSPAGQCIAVVVFRFFDMVKPNPIGWLDMRYKSGFGVMLDDVVAALFTLLTLAVGLYYWR